MIKLMLLVIIAAAISSTSFTQADKISRRPMVGAVYFYWYTWDYEKELGNWLGGVYNTPLYGYYDSRSYEDNLKSMRVACEWGLTHLFMDYWQPTWKALTGELRELILMCAVEELQREGYDIWMSYYQDGWDFRMKDFKENIKEGRDVYLWLKQYANSPAWPKLNNGYPLQLVYGRNGAPIPSEDNQAFQRFLKEKYENLEALNKLWGTDFNSFDEISLDYSGGSWRRVESINFQYEVWRKAWAELDERCKEYIWLPRYACIF